METILIDKNDLKTAYDEAGRIIRSGGLVAFPTETVYGLGGNALDADASAKIYAAKGRPSDNPLIVHIADREELYPLVREIPDAAEKLMDRFWPGPLTLIFRKTDVVPKETTGGLETVAVRMPSHPVAAEFIRASGVPIAAPSANTSGRPSPTMAEHVVEDLSGRIDMILDGGSVGIGLESTIVDVTGEVPMILRPGYITKAMIEETVGQTDIDPAVRGTDEGVMATGTAPKAPGMKYRHYAPKSPLYIVRGSRQSIERKLIELESQASERGLRAGYILSDDMEAPKGAAKVYRAGARGDEEAIAASLYGILRQCDYDSLDVIYSDDFGLGDSSTLGYAIRNRLMKAAGGHQILCE